MGIIADSFANYAQPLFDETDGSIDKMNRAMTIAQMCWNFALLPENQRETAIDELKPALNMTDEVFADFRQKFILPMIHRHHEMFPGLHVLFKQTSNNNSPLPLGEGLGINDSPLPLGEGLGVRADREREYRCHSLTTDKQPSSTIGPASSEKKKYSTTDRYASCPCGSGRKYKFCCGAHK